MKGQFWCVAVEKRAPCKYTTARYAGIKFRNNLFAQDYDNRVSICAVINFHSISFPVYNSIGQFNSKIASLHECIGSALVPLV